MAKFGDRRTKRGREEAFQMEAGRLIFKIIAIPFKLAWFVFKQMFNVVVFVCKLLFHMVTLGKFKSIKEEKN